MVAFNTVKPGDILYESRRTKMGNTTASRLSCWLVKIIEVHPNHVIASWNSNTPERMSSSRVGKMTRMPPKGTGEREAWDRRKAMEKGQ